MDEKLKKKVDEYWKNQVGREKKEADSDSKTYHEPTFTIFLSSIGMQAMIALGKFENPISQKTEVNHEQARFLIDTLGIIKEKTKGNLTPEEEKFLNESLFNLRMAYVEEKEKK
ncbi:MAG: DUF1844 domain-containing protein [Candidatus Omnitrophota bacterium]